MHLILSAVLLCLTAIAAGAQTMTETEKFYIHAKSQFDLQDYQDPYYEAMQVLDDEEHGTNDPSRLIFFNEILKAEARTDKTDQEILVPWLIRYIWVTKHPNYTQGAVRLLLNLPLDDDLIAVISKDILGNHPHGLARAAVIEPSDSYRSWFEDDDFIELVQPLSLTDPHPDVRRNALEALYDAQYSVDQITQALNTDPAAEVRALWAARLVTQIREADKTEPILREALFSPKNLSVAPAILLTYLSSGPIKSDLQRLSQGLNFVAVHKDYPQQSQLIDAFGWQTDRAAVPMLLTGAPYADGEALRLWLHTKFADTSAPMIERSFALSALSQIDRERIDVQAIADFMLNPDHDNDSLDPLFDLSLGSRALRRLFVIWPDSMVSQTKTQKELIDLLLAHFSKPRLDGKPLAGTDVQIGLLFELQRSLKSVRSPDVQALLVETLLTHAAKSPVDLTYGVSDLLGRRDVVSDESFLTYASSNSIDFSTGLSTAFIDRLRPGPWEDPEIKPGDLTLAIKLIALSEARHPGKPDDAYQAVYDLIYQLPKKSEMPDGLPDLDQFEAKLRDMQTRAVREDGYWAIENWLEEK